MANAWFNRDWIYPHRALDRFDIVVTLWSCCSATHSGFSPIIRFQLTDECRALYDHLMPPAIRRLATQGIRPQGA